MIVHIYINAASAKRYLSPEMTKETGRVSMFNQYPSWDVPVLVLGTLPNVVIIPMRDINWFWIEGD